MNTKLVARNEETLRGLLKTLLACCCCCCCRRRRSLANPRRMTAINLTSAFECASAHNHCGCTTTHLTCLCKQVFSMTRKRVQILRKTQQLYDVIERRRGCFRSIWCAAQIECEIGNHTHKCKTKMESRAKSEDE